MRIYLIISISALFLLLNLFRRRYYDYPVRKAILFSLLSALYGVIGLRLLYILENPWRDIHFLEGFSLYGGIFFIPIAMALTALIMREPVGKVLDFSVIIAPLGTAISRIGCYRSGCCGADEIMCFGEMVRPPIQLIEMGCCIIIFAILMYFEVKKLITVRGEQYFRYLMMYGFVRLVMENYRDTPKNLLGMSHGQWYAIASVLIGSSVMFFIRKKAAEQKQKK